jgi:hypothetical protein
MPGRGHPNISGLVHSKAAEGEIRELWFSQTPKLLINWRLPLFWRIFPPEENYSGRYIHDSVRIVAGRRLLSA